MPIRGIRSKSTSCDWWLSVGARNQNPQAHVCTQMHAPIFLLILRNFDQNVIYSNQLLPLYFIFDKKKKKSKHHTKQTKDKKESNSKLIAIRLSYFPLERKKIGIFGFSRLLGKNWSEFNLLCPSVTSKRRGISVFSYFRTFWGSTLHAGSSILSLLPTYFPLFSITSWPNFLQP